jgi:23S rRNA (guanosine2251-2'-O)-methyltransferase
MAGGERLLLGFHPVIARLRAHPDSVREVLVQARRDDPRLRELVALAQRQGVRVQPVDGARLDGLSEGARHQGVVARVAAREGGVDLHDLLAAKPQAAFLLLLDGVTDPHNLGACLRTADAMGVDGVVVPKDRSVGLTPTVAKVASGAAETVPVVTVTNLVRAMETLKEAGVWLLGAAEEGDRSLLEIDLSGPIGWVLGAEGQGLRRLTREHCDALVRIPMFGSVASLNVSVAAALCLFETRRQRELGAGPAPRP